MLPRMLDDWMKMCVDIIYEPKIVKEPDRVNEFDCLYREEQACTSKGKLPINKRRPYSLDLCYPITELKP